MNREIKFRAWDKNSKTILYVLDNPSWAGTTGKLIDSFEDEDLMQYTGLKDKNGKEIYEGDIVKSRHQEKAIVIWDIENACFATETVDDVVKGEKQYCLPDVEVIIGNIYENPGLLK